MFEKQEIKDGMSIEEVEDILELLGAHSYRESDEKLIIETICHNHPGEGSHKLYYYTNTKLFNCYTNCGSFDIFELVAKVREHYGEDLTLDDAISWVVDRRGFMFFEGELTKKEEVDEAPKEYVKPTLSVYDRQMFDKLKPVLVRDWLEEGISKETHEFYEIKYNPIDGAVMFPHYDERGGLVGIRQRNLAEDIIARFGKYRPATIRGTLYTSPLSFYLFGVYKNKWAIKRTKRVIVFEGEKSVMKMDDLGGRYHNNTVASFGINFSMHHFKILEALGVEEIVFAFDRQYKEPNAEDKEYVSLAKRLERIHGKYASETMTLSFMMDTEDKLDYKDAPVDKGLETFEYLFENRFTLEVKNEV